MVFRKVILNGFIIALPTYLKPLRGFLKVNTKYGTSFGRKVIMSLSSFFVAIEKVTDVDVKAFVSLAQTHVTASLHANKVLVQRISKLQ